MNVFLTQLRPEIYESFRKSGIIDLVGEERVYDSMASAIADVEMRQLVQGDVAVSGSGEV